MLALTKDEAAHEARVSLSTIERAIATKELRSAKIGRARRILVTDLVAWLESHIEEAS